MLSPGPKGPEQAGYSAIEASLTPAALQATDGVFATNSLRLVMPVARLDGRALAVAPVAPVLTWVCGLVEAAWSKRPAGQC